MLTSWLGGSSATSLRRVFPSVENRPKTALIIGYELAGFGTFFYLLHEGGFTWWNWPIIIGADAFLAQIWPIYWLILRPFFE